MTVIETKQVSVNSMLLGSSSSVSLLNFEAKRNSLLACQEKAGHLPVGVKKLLQTFGIYRKHTNVEAEKSLGKFQY